MLEFRPLTDEVWKDFETPFGERGACGGLLVHVVAPCGKGPRGQQG